MKVKKILAGWSTMVVLLCFLHSCSREAPVPEVELSASKTTVEPGEEVTFTVTGAADGLAIYTGDAGHEFEFSKYILTKDQDIEKEVVCLTQRGYDSLAASGLLEDSTLGFIRSLVGTRYNGLSHPTELVLEFTNYELQYDPRLPQLQGYFTIEHFTGAPASGYAAGTALDPESAPVVYRYSYPEVGTYAVRLLATNVGRKKFTPDGYNKNRVTNENEYNRNTQVKTVTITVE
ncbi:DUF5017 domain-containing protein [Niabella aurantiaca]|uniref:DUF5017 domain-containing protein n=1 Tax=Niabella aurantiaca TaxID=379900 RepID=UPI00037191FA|nr:DUF5017 domain-containing protein [Niabella aurantiaca]